MAIRTASLKRKNSGKGKGWTICRVIRCRHNSGELVASLERSLLK